MSEKDNGGPAFPIEMTATPYAPGMTLRDWFAGQIACGDTANSEGGVWKNEAGRARFYYRLADAMLEARK